MACNCSTCRSHHSDESPASVYPFDYRPFRNESRIETDTDSSFDEAYTDMRRRIAWEEAGRPLDTTDGF